MYGIVKYTAICCAVLFIITPSKWMVRTNLWMQNKPTLRIISGLLIICLGYFAMGVVLWRAASTLPPIRDLWLAVTSNGRWMFSFGLIFIVLLYALRKFVRWLYGLTEIIVGLVALALFNQEPSGIVVDWIVLYAAPIYVAIRGLDNFDRGLPDRWRSRFWWLGNKPTG
ncbi:MAG: hypothetical protein ABIS51_05045 [Sphingomonas sp.]